MSDALTVQGTLFVEWDNTARDDRHRIEHRLEPTRDHKPRPEYFGYGTLRLSDGHVCHVTVTGDIDTTGKFRRVRLSVRTKPNT